MAGKGFGHLAAFHSHSCIGRGESLCCHWGQLSSPPKCKSRAVPPSPAPMHRLIHNSPVSRQVPQQPGHPLLGTGTDVTSTPHAPAALSGGGSSVSRADFEPVRAKWPPSQHCSSCFFTTLCLGFPISQGAALRPL